MPDATILPRQPGRHRDDAKLAALEQRVYGLERGVQDLNQLFTGRIGEVSAQLSGLAAKLDERSRTPWATIVSAMGVVLAIVVAGGHLAKSPIVDAIVRIERDLARLEATATPYGLFSEFKGTYETNRLLARQDADQRFLRVDAAIADLAQQMREGQAAAVGRGELAERWRADDLARTALQRQIDEARPAGAARAPTGP